MEPSQSSKPIETPRLWLLEVTADAVSFADADDQQSFLDGYEQFLSFNHGKWAVFSKEDGSFMGWCGLKLDAATGETALGFRLQQKYWNNAFSAEVAAACINYGFTVLHLTSIAATVKQQNKAVIKVLQKSGMKEVRTPVSHELQSEYKFVITKMDFLNSL